MKQLMIAAALAALSVTSSAYAACQAHMDISGKQITGASMGPLSRPSGVAKNVATKAYVDNLMAGTTSPKLELSKMFTPAVTLAAAVAGCANENRNNAGITGRPWRLPTMSELVVAVSSYTTVDYTAEDASMLWTRTPFEDPTAAYDSSTGSRIKEQGKWIASDLKRQSWSSSLATDSRNYRCVR